VALPQREGMLKMEGSCLWQPEREVVQYRRREENRGGLLL